MRRSHEEAPSMTQGQLAVWAKREFKLIAAPVQNTISDILINAAKIKNEAYGDKRRRKPVKATSAALESGLNAWVARVESKNVNINRMVLAEKAQQLQKIGWLTRFLDRHDMRFRIKKGEAFTRRSGHVLQDELGLYEPNNVFNMDEAGLCYNRTPVGDICPGTSLKTRITVAFCANADGSEMLPLLYIGRAFKPRCLKKTGKEHGFNYEKN
ncbi:hypothetical protein PHMEG_00015038 [Phytophthora megakarya]|uniref:HTH CENPB-type domain-containing protein n=1 Tax=Phytophthora megakarya TaxID=4795 RepID=A0A225W2B0_9STRA|nr:hypothetical protein PHMEG_00015038 [Phytophthora megakarya]